jgi:hypothetical protein
MPTDYAFAFNAVTRKAQAESLQIGGDEQNERSLLASEAFADVGVHLSKMPKRS